MSKLTQIPWVRLVAESAAIVGSILLAFAVDAWWEERRERDYEQETLLGLESEYEGHRDTIVVQTEFHRYLMRGIGNLMQACLDGTYSASDITIDDAVYFSLVPVTTDMGSGARDSLISAGRIEVLRDRNLRYALLEWDSVLGEVTDGQLFSSDLVRELLLPFYAKAGITLGHGENGKDRSPWPVTTRALADSPESMERLFADPAYCTTLEYRYGHMNHTLDEYEALLAAIDKILTLIRTSTIDGEGETTVTATQTGAAMTGYIDGFVVPIPRDKLADYQRLVASIAKIWKEHGALDYREFVGDDLHLEGTRSFVDAAGAAADDAIVFGWVSFASRAARDQANEKVAADPRVATLMSEADIGFDAGRMAYGGFNPLVPPAQ